MKNDSSTRWSEENFKKAVKNSITVSGALRHLGLEPAGNYRTFYKYKHKFNVDTSHFVGRSHLLGKKREISKTA